MYQHRWSALAALLAVTVSLFTSDAGAQARQRYRLWPEIVNRNILVPVKLEDAGKEKTVEIRISNPTDYVWTVFNISFDGLPARIDKEDFWEGMLGERGKAEWLPSMSWLVPDKAIHGRFPKKQTTGFPVHVTVPALLPGFTDAPVRYTVTLQGPNRAFRELRGAFTFQFNKEQPRLAGAKKQSDPVRWRCGSASLDVSASCEGEGGVPETSGESANSWVKKSASVECKHPAPSTASAEGSASCSARGKSLTLSLVSATTAQGGFSTARKCTSGQPSAFCYGKAGASASGNAGLTIPETEEEFTYNLDVRGIDCGKISDDSEASVWMTGPDRKAVRLRAGTQLKPGKYALGLSSKTGTQASGVGNRSIAFTSARRQACTVRLSVAGLTEKELFLEILSSEPGWVRINGERRGFLPLGEQQALLSLPSDPTTRFQFEYLDGTITSEQAFSDAIETNGQPSLRFAKPIK